jgi:hypothetical protein
MNDVDIRLPKERSENALQKVLQACGGWWMSVYYMQWSLMGNYTSELWVMVLMHVLLVVLYYLGKISWWIPCLLVGGGLVGVILSEFCFVKIRNALFVNPKNRLVDRYAAFPVDHQLCMTPKESVSFQEFIERGTIRFPSQWSTKYEVVRSTGYRLNGKEKTLRFVDEEQNKVNALTAKTVLIASIFDRKLKTEDLNQSVYSTPKRTLDPMRVPGHTLMDDINSMGSSGYTPPGHHDYQQYISLRSRRKQAISKIGNSVHYSQVGGGPGDYLRFREQHAESQLRNLIDCEFSVANSLQDDRQGLSWNVATGNHRPGRRLTRQRMARVNKHVQLNNNGESVFHSVNDVVNN